MTSPDFDQQIQDAFGSAALAQIFRESFDEQAQPGVHGFSFVPTRGLAQIADLLGSGHPVGTLLDAGCGWGGIGLWLAERLRCNLIGIDSSAAAIAHATTISPPTGIRAGFQVGSFTATGLADTQVDAVVAVDAFHFAPDPEAAAAELLRVVRPGGRLVLTLWSTKTGPDRFTRDYPETLAAAGWSIDTVEERPEWLAAQLRLYRAAIARGTAETDPAVLRLQGEGAAVTPLISSGRRILIAASRPGMPA